MTLKLNPAGKNLSRFLPKVSNLGIRTKLFASFGAVVALTVVSVGIAIFAFSKLEAQFNGLATGEIPSLANAANLANVKALVTIETAALVNAGNEKSRVTSFKALSQATTELQNQAENLVASPFTKEIVQNLKKNTSGFTSIIANLNQQTKSRIEIGEQKAKNLSRLFEAREALGKIIDPLIDESYFNLTIEGEDATTKMNEILNNLANKEITKLRYLLEIRAEVNLISGMYVSHVLATEESYKSIFKDRISGSKSRLIKAIEGLKALKPDFVSEKSIADLITSGTKSLGLATDGFNLDAQSAALTSILNDQQRSDNLLAEEIDNQVFQLTIDTEESVGQNSKVISTILESGVGKLKATLEAVSNLHQFVSLLVEGALTNNRDLIIPLAERIVAQGARLKVAMTDAGISDGKEQLKVIFALADVDKGLLSMRLSEFDATSASQEIVKQVFDVTRDFGNKIDKLTTIERSRIEEATKTITTLFKNSSIALIAVGLTSILIALAIGILIADRGIVRPLSKLVEVTRELAEGNLDVHLSEEERRDEIGAMSSAVSIFRSNELERRKLEHEQSDRNEAESRKQEKIEALIVEFRGEVKESLSTVLDCVDQMQATSTALGHTAEEASEKATSAASSSTEASNNVQTVAAAANELTTSIDEVSRQISDTTSIVSKATTEAEESNQKVVELSNAAADIGNVINLIQDIAEQTNLLALNATIESARAGEAGKGFAVVASEVKSLAGQTAKATDDIRAKIDAIQISTQESVESIRGIAETMGEANEYTLAIASAVTQQGEATGEISRNVEEAAKGTEDVAENMSGVSKAIEETNQTVSQVGMAAQEVAQQANDLRDKIDHFITEVSAA
jgi:methyl-accepting chemotaxis protein